MGLIEFMRAAFFRRNAASLTKTSKHRASADNDTGPEAARKYRLKHPRGLNQIQRFLRIEAEKRPLKFEVLGKRERHVLSKGAGR